LILANFGILSFNYPKVSFSISLQTLRHSIFELCRITAMFS